MMAMRYRVKFDTEVLFAATTNSITYTQDTVHLGAKLRNRLLKPSIVLPFGNKQVTVAHLKILIKTVPKNVHGLIYKDICPLDRQNYLSVEKIMKKRVLDALTNHVIDSEATVIYLKLCGKVTSSFRELNIEPLERINRIWYALFFYRIWRQWIKKNKYSVTENFITLNAYSCIEINAYGLVQIMRKFRDDCNDDLFLPMLFDSQQCEQTFRQLRTMTTLNWTKVNFTILELTHMISRIDLQNDITYFKLKDSGITFPRIKNRIDKMPLVCLPTDEEIKNTIKLAKQSALDDAKQFGISLRENEISECDLPPVKTNFIDSTDTEDFGDDDDFDENIEMDIYNFNEHEDLSDMMSDLNIVDGDDSRFTVITDENGLAKLVPKSYVVWLLSKSKENPSSDRLQRVRFRPLHRNNRRSASAPHFSSRLSQIRISEEISIGQWCMFVPASNKRNLMHKIESYIVGAITGFHYSSGKTQKEKSYTLDSAKVNNSNIQAVATWYKINRSGELVTIKGKNTFYINIQNYFATIAEPQFDGKKIFVSVEALSQIDDCLVKFLENRLN